MSKVVLPIGVFQNAYSEPYRGSDLVCPEPTLAQQSFKDDADINVMLEKFKVTGVLPTGVVMPSYGDFSAVMDYRSAKEAMRKAENAFMDMPASIRSRFNNDPQEFLEFCSKDENRAEAERLGLVPPRPVEKAPEAPSGSAEPMPTPSGSATS